MAPRGQPTLPRFVKVKIRTSLTGSVAKRITGLEALHDKTVQLNCAMTWQEAFLAELKVSVDPDKYSVTRVHRSNAPVKRKHNLMEDIRILLSEFKRPMPVYSIFVIENAPVDDVGHGGPPKLVPVKPLVSKKNAGLNLQSVTKLKLGVGNVVTTKVTVGRGKKQSTNQNWTKTKPTSSAFNESEIDNDNLFYRASAKSGLSDKKKKTNVQEAASSGHEVGMKVGIKRHAPPTATTSQPSTRQRMSEDTLENSMTRGRGRELPLMPRFSLRNENYGDLFHLKNNNVDDDACSDASQDSQVEDLHGLGILNEDVRSGFMARASTNYSNSQILKARHELHILKSSKSVRWTKWTLAAPMASNIIRDLLGI